MTTLFFFDRIDTSFLSEWGLKNRIELYNEEIAKCEEELRVRSTRLTATEKALVICNLRILAIKSYRDRTSAGLTDAKDAIDAWATANPGRANIPED